MKNFLKCNIKLVISFIIGLIVAGTTVYAATVLSGKDVSYSNASSGLTSTTVQGAIDELYKKANTWIDQSYIDLGTLATNSAKTILASSKGVCVKRNNKLNCFKTNNFDEEKDHIQQVFSDISCDVSSSLVDCRASDFYCNVRSSGNVSCGNYSVTSYCDVGSGGSVNCT